MVTDHEFCLGSSAQPLYIVCSPQENLTLHWFNGEQSFLIVNRLLFYGMNQHILYYFHILHTAALGHQALFFCINFLLCTTAAHAVYILWYSSSVKSDANTGKLAPAKAAVSFSHSDTLHFDISIYHFHLCTDIIDISIYRCSTICGIWFWGFVGSRNSFVMLF